MRRFSVLAGTFLAVAPVLAQTPTNPMRMVLRTGATCHTSASGTSEIAHGYRVGDLVSASKTSTDADGRLWYFDSWRVSGNSPSCWIVGKETTPFDLHDPAKAYAAVVDHVLARKDPVPFDEYVEVENLLESKSTYDNAPPILVQRFPLLQFKSLLLIDRALTHVVELRIRGAPLERAWINAHASQLDFNDPSASWQVSDSVYWSLWDQNKTAPWAEDLAWAAAQLAPQGDECGADCHLEMIMIRPQMYWIRYPGGTHIAKALEDATKWAAEAPLSISEGLPTREMINRVRSSLTEVHAPEKGKLLDQLAKLDRLVKPSP